MVLSQFVLSSVLVMLTLVMSDQLTYMKTKDLGFRDELLLVVERNGVARQDFFPAYRDALRQHPHVAGFTATAPAFTKGSYRSNFQYEGRQIDYNIFFVQSDFVEVMDMELAEGRFFDGEHREDSAQHIVVNEAFVNALGWEQPLNRPVPELENAGLTEPEIIGVVKDFHFESVGKAVRPLWMVLASDNNMADLVIRLTPQNIQATLTDMEDVWHSIAPEVPFTYSFLDDDLAQLYLEEERWVQVIRLAGAFALTIAYLGLFGLITLTLAARKREISIRKVLGAGFWNLTRILSLGFLRMIGGAALLATPLA
ncbi:MAG TPA: hypothetical protein DCR93_03215, partial [Cytophagales bacterium]|nr:hypothetical protein [Cytophagales bacterium]